MTMRRLEVGAFVSEGSMARDCLPSEGIFQLLSLDSFFAALAASLAFFASFASVTT